MLRRSLPSGWGTTKRPVYSSSELPSFSGLTSDIVSPFGKLSTESGASSVSAKYPQQREATRIQSLLLKRCLTTPVQVLPRVSADGA